MAALASVALAAALAAAASPASPPAAGRSIDEALAALARIPRFSEVALSPDGGRVAWVAPVLGKDGPVPRRSRISVADVATGRTARVTAGTGADADEAGLAWSPDGRSLAFLSDAGTPGQQQLWVADLAAPPRRLTSVRGGLAAPAFSRDGKRIALLHVEGERREGAARAAPRETGALDEYWAVQRVAVVDRAGGPLRAVSPEGLFVYEYDWAPDGSAFAAIGARGPGDASWWTAELVLLPSSGGEARRLVGPGRQLAEPRFSPDGKAVAFVAGLMSDEGVVGGDVFLVPAGGGEPRDLTPGRRASASTLAWTGPDRLVAAAWADGGSAIAAIRPGDGAVEELWRGDERLSPEPWRIHVSLSRDGARSAVVRERFDREPSVEVGPIGAWRPVGKPPAAVALAGPARKLRWRTDAGEVQGWLLPPPALDPARVDPLVVIVHGGPSSAVVPGLAETALLLASRGYWVLLPNPRGSFGQGEAFARANVRDFGGGDLRDVLAGVDAALGAAPIDPARVGLFGWSYGGFMTMWAVTQTDRFHAAVAGAGISNWQSYYGTNRIDTWMIPFFGASVYDDPDAYRRCSAIERVKKIRTPTLLLHGERDAEVPVTQSRELWKALRALGVPTQLVVYPDAGHMLEQPAHRRDRLARTVGWFDRWLGPAGEARR
jgi:dipeptidyl aminopeptidase/acylaminoacyl peptidase